MRFPLLRDEKLNPWNKHLNTESSVLGALQVWLSFGSHTPLLKPGSNMTFRSGKEVRLGLTPKESPVGSPNVSSNSGCQEQDQWSFHLPPIYCWTFLGSSSYKILLGYGGIVCYSHTVYVDCEPMAALLHIFSLQYPGWGTAPIRNIIRRKREDDGTWMWLLKLLPKSSMDHIHSYCFG